MQSQRILLLVLAPVLVVLAFSVSTGRSGHAQTTGDVNCDGSANSIDASLILQLSAGLTASVLCDGAADPNNDGETDALDSALILQFSAGLIDEVPGEKPAQDILGAPGVIKFIGSGTIDNGPRRSGYAYLSGAGAPAQTASGQRALGDTRALPNRQRKDSTHAAGGGVRQEGVAQESTVATSNPELNLSFDGLNAPDQELSRAAQRPLEPPDQGLCVGNGYVLESVNSALRVFDTGGNALTDPIALSQFYGYPDAPLTDSFDITCYYDPDTGLWFHVALTVDIDPATGLWWGPNRVDLAVSQTSDPLGRWNHYAIPAQNDGTEGTPNHRCHLGPCLGDFPHIGADRNGFYITTNEWPLLDEEEEEDTFVGVNLYAISKTHLATGHRHPTIVHFSRFDYPVGGRAYRVWPAISADSAYEDAANGTEYFVSSTDCYVCPGDDRLIVWALKNTASLDSTRPSPRLTSTVVDVEPYTMFQPLAEQPPGDNPIGECINDTTIATPLGVGCWRYGPFFEEPAHNEVEPALDPGWDINQVYYADGSLWTAQTTVLAFDGEDKTGIAYYILRPEMSATGLEVQVEQEGQFGLPNNNLIFPTVAATSAGQGVISFTLVGEDHFPSAAYVTFDRTHDAVDIHVAAAGLGPVDGFTGYAAFNNGEPAVQRFGDYGAAAVDGDTIWVASEYVGQTCTLQEYLTETDESPRFSCGGTRTAAANWYTRISQLNP